MLTCHGLGTGEQDPALTFNQQLKEFCGWEMTEKKTSMERASLSGGVTQSLIMSIAFEKDLLPS